MVWKSKSLSIDKENIQSYIFTMIRGTRPNQQWELLELLGSIMENHIVTRKFHINNENPYNGQGYRTPYQ